MPQHLNWLYTALKEPALSLTEFTIKIFNFLFSLHFVFYAYRVQILELRLNGWIWWRLIGLQKNHAQSTSPLKCLRLQLCDHHHLIAHGKLHVVRYGQNFRLDAGLITVFTQLRVCCSTYSSSSFTTYNNICTTGFQCIYGRIIISIKP